jgi:hypothetical protein
MPLAQTLASGFRLQACVEECMTIRLVRTMVAVLVLCGVAAVGFAAVGLKAGVLGPAIVAGDDLKGGAGTGKTG